MKTIQKGFTLIELMIVIAIIGILAAIAIPAYQDYTIKAQVSEGPSLAAGLKTAIAEYYATNGSWPTSATNGLPQPTGKYEYLTYANPGVITINYSSASPYQANAKLTSTGTILDIYAGASANGDIIWVCGLATPPSSGVTWANGSPDTATTVAAKYLPASCKQ
jgi:type IV pilus assembly protein PilA